MTKDQAIILLQRYRQGLCSEEEKEAIEQWHALLEAKGEWQWTEDEKAIFEKELFEQIVIETTAEKTIKAAPIRRITVWRRIAAAVLLLGASVFTWISLSRNNEKKAIEQPIVKVQESNDVSPGKTGAILTLSSGQKILLDTTADGAIPVQGGQPISNQNGTLTYNDQYNSGVLAYNSINTPKGRQYKLVLSDGTRVWLNAASSLYYPVYFANKQRTVEVSGEAYFEVAEKRDENGKKLPFTVKIINVQGLPAEVQVLGTHFNVNGYEDEKPGIAVTLLEGSVNVNNGRDRGLLKPGQQALVTESITVANDVDMDFVMAWKNGYFQFEKSSLQNVLKQISRWYDVEVIYKGTNQPRQFEGEMQKDLKLSEMLKILEKNNVHFKIEGKKLIIEPD